MRFISQALFFYGQILNENFKEERAMHKTWITVIVAAIFEVAWVIGMKHADNFLEWIGTVIAIYISFYLMIKAARSLAVGTVYAVFVGLGTTGTVVADILLFDADLSVTKIVLIGLLLIGVIGLKMLSKKKEEVSGI
ncbi:multidrug resistance protein ykkC [Paenibacillus sabinae T27]|uniref:Multidrug resistance protein ykkC n=2 Tax=Paenibacillus sabinae TaxID=365617 RepID=X4ZJR2_9BACL|nr:multidrug resistance protein ykkC [Paenibacillus sabinae T27]